MAKELVKDYGLNEDEVLEVNFNRVMAHIGVCRTFELLCLLKHRNPGIQFQLVIIPPVGG